MSIWFSTSAKAVLCVGFAVSGLQLASAQQVDLSNLISLLPEEVIVTHDAPTYDPATDITTFSNFRITSTFSDEVGLQMGELSLSGLDEQFLMGRIEQTNYDQAGTLVEYLLIKDMSLLGAELFYGDAERKLMEIFDPEKAAEDFGPDRVATESLNKLVYSIGQIEASNVSFLPFLAADPNEDTSSFSNPLFGLRRSFANIIGMSAGSLDLTDFRFDFELEGEEIGVVDVELAVDRFKIEGWEGGNLGLIGLEGARMGGIFPNMDDPDINAESIEFGFEIGAYTIEDVRLDKALSAILDGERPEMTDTDFLSLGRFKLANERMTFFGVPIVSVAGVDVDLRHFHWLVPTAVDLKYDNVTYHFSDLLRIAPLMADAEIDAETASQILEFEEIIAAYGLDELTFDVDLRYRWDPDNGPGSLGLAFEMENYGRLALDVAVTTANFDGFVDAIEAERNGALDPEEFIGETASISLISLEMEDYGGINNLVGLTLDAANHPTVEENPLAIFSAMDPVGLKGMIAGGLTLALSSQASEFPLAPEYAQTISKYINEGGKLRWAMEPETPLKLSVVEKLEEASDLTEVFDILSISFVHTPPPAAE